MKIRTAIIALIIAAQLSCSSDDVNINSFKDDPSITTLNGTWEVVSFENYSDNNQEFKSEENSEGLDIIIKFDDTKDPNEISGTNTRNTVLGEFGYIQPRKLKVDNYGSTHVAQPAWGDKFNQAILGGEVDFEINKSRLRIYYDNKSKSVTLVRK
jgi:hypothetical protein